MGDAGVGEVFELEERRWAAMIAKDTATLSELFADEMSATHANAVATRRPRISRPSTTASSITRRLSAQTHTPAGSVTRCW